MILTYFTLLMPTFALLQAENCPSGQPCFSCRTLPYRSVPMNRTRGFGGMLEPRYIFGAKPLDQ